MNKDEIIKKLQIKNGKLQVQIERLKLDKEEYYLDYLDLQQRIDKAIEYIEHLRDEYFRRCIFGSSGDLSEIIDILEDKDNESN